MLSVQIVNKPNCIRRTCLNAWLFRHLLCHYRSVSFNFWTHSDCYCVTCFAFLVKPALTVQRLFNRKEKSLKREIYTNYICLILRLIKSSFIHFHSFANTHKNTTDNYNEYGLRLHMGIAKHIF